MVIVLLKEDILHRFHSYATKFPQGLLLLLLLRRRRIPLAGGKFLIFSSVDVLKKEIKSAAAAAAAATATAVAAVGCPEGI
ncbi:hypothetical protein M0802_015504 [Mischocyttarus mexicanus]|nr:hypothetical protein M0802_015504 [Mischocyttarus mexicanus]